MDDFKSMIISVNGEGDYLDNPDEDEVYAGESFRKSSIGSFTSQEVYYKATHPHNE